MLLADSSLIPAFDMLGLPMPAWLAQTLMALTLALHWAFLSMTAGGAVAYVHSRRRPVGGVEAVGKKLAAFLPLSLTTAMTLGIAPLLFVQVLYGQFFYTANILMGYVWLGLLALMIANFYLLYYAWRRIRDGRGVAAVGAAILLLLAVSAMILSANATLAQSPQAWQAFRAKGGVAPYLGDATFWPRWLMALSALFAGGGLFVAIFTRLGAGDAPAARPHVARALHVAVAGLLGMIAFGLWGATRLPEPAHAALLSGAESPFTYAAAAALALCLIVTAAARLTPSPPRLLLAAAAFLASLLALAAARDTLRRAALADHFRLADVPVHPQWTSFTLFAIVLVGGLALIAYIVRLAFAPRGPNATEK